MINDGDVQNDKFYSDGGEQCGNSEDETFTGDGEANREALIEDWDFSFSPWTIHFESFDKTCCLLLQYVLSALSF